MGGIDILTFTAGAGEGSPALRRELCERLAFLGFRINQSSNEHAYDDRVISLSTPHMLVVHAREDIVMASHATAVTEGANVSRGH